MDRKEDLYFHEVYLQQNKENLDFFSVRDLSMSISINFYNDEETFSMSRYHDAIPAPLHLGGELDNLT